MDFELKAAKEKWEREQKQRKEQAKARLEREKKAKEEAARIRDALEAAQRLRRLEEAEAAAAAKQQEENDLYVGDGIRFNVVLQATPISGEGDKINLPPSAVEDLSSQGALAKGPMFFEISVDYENEMHDVTDERNTHSGVLQFTAPEGCAQLPPHVWNNARLPAIATSAGTFVRVRYVRLPKCTYAKLKPEVPEFADVPNHKAVLETKLRQHATLSEGDVLVVRHGGSEYNLHVLELKPSSSVSVLETDMEVDLVQSTTSESQNGRFTPLEIGKPECGYVEEGGYKYFRFTLDEKLLNAVHNREVELSVHLEIEGEGATNDADLYVAAHPVLFPTQHQHQWASHDVGSKTIHLSNGERVLSANSYSIGVFGFQGNSKFKVLVQPQAHQQITAQRVGVGHSQLEAGFELCGNCKQAIPSRTIALHEAYCRRHNIVCNHPGCGVVLRRQEFEKHVHCPKCGQSLQSEELQKHLKVYHEPQKCNCGATLEMDAMVKHQENSCPLRMVTCRFCSGIFEAGVEVEDLRDKLQGLTGHESLCGSRTAPCESCGRSIMLKEMDIHRIAAHDLKDGGRELDIPSLSEGYNNTSTTGMPASMHAPMEHIKCPICSYTVDGVTAEMQLNSHLESEHFNRSNLLAPPEPVSQTSITNSSSSFRSSLSVSCPICGLAVHSERDLSVHIDMVH